MKRLPIGISDYKEIVEEGYSYVDKTLLIEEIIQCGAKVILIPRPRRFGKTMNLSMLKYFFEKTKEDYSPLFQRFNIWKTLFRERQGEFPLIFLTLKGIKKGNWSEAYRGIQSLIASEFERHSYLMDSNSLSKNEKKDFQNIMDKIPNDQNLFENSLKQLTYYLKKHHDKRVVVLIDEYDTPVLDSYLSGYYDPMILFMRNWFTEGLKDNSCLEKAVLTGVLRVSKESVFSGLNNPGCYTVLDEAFADKFGLLEEEVAGLLEEYGISLPIEEIRKWYNGYRIGQNSLYNPWSILQCIEKKGELRPYWVNTSDNELIKKLVIQGSPLLKKDLEKLLLGETIAKPINEGTVFKNLTGQTDSVWGLFLFTGYLTLVEKPVYKEGVLQCKLKIPNQEIHDLYKAMIVEWMTRNLPSDDLVTLLDSLTTGDVETFSKIFQVFIVNCVSFYDTAQDEPEKVYHAFVLGLLITLTQTHEVKSNRESGFGRYDVCLIPKDPSSLGVVIEFKKVDEKEDLEKGAEDALKQIEEKKYAAELKSRGIKKILSLGMAFKGKCVFIKERLL